MLGALLFALMSELLQKSLAKTSCGRRARGWPSGSWVGVGLRMRCSLRRAGWDPSKAYEVGATELVDAGNTVAGLNAMVLMRLTAQLATVSWRP